MILPRLSKRRIGKRLSSSKIIFSSLIELKLMYPVRLLTYVKVEASYVDNFYDEKN